MTEQKRVESEYDRKSRERQEKDDLDRLNKLAYIERGIAPLLFEPPNQGNERDMRRARHAPFIITPDGERVGSLQLTNRYSYSTGIRYRVYSKRIPYSSRRRWGQTYRDYTKIDSVVAAIKKFMFAVSNDETRAKVLREEISHYNSKIQNSNSDSRRVMSDEKYGSPLRQPSLNIIVDGLVAHDAEAQATMDTLVKKRRVHLRFAAWLNTNFIEPRQKELNALDTSKENIR